MVLSFVLGSYTDMYETAMSQDFLPMFQHSYPNNTSNGKNYYLNSKNSLNGIANEII